MRARNAFGRATRLLSASLAIGLAPLLGAIAATKTPAAAVPVPQDPPGVRIAMFPDGLTVVLRPDGVAPVVTFGMVYGVGTRAEGPQLAGAAQLVERMTSEGTDRFEPGQMAELLARNDAAYGSAVTDSYTCFAETYSADRLPLGLLIEADRMRHAKMGPAQLQAALGTATPSLSLQALGRFYQRYYRPDDAIAVLEGDFDLDRAYALIHQDFDPQVMGPELPARSGLDPSVALAAVDALPRKPATASLAVPRFATQPFEFDPMPVRPPGGISTETLANGLELTVVDDPLAPTAAVAGYVRVGTILDKVDPSGHHGTAGMVAGLLDRPDLTFRAGRERTTFAASVPASGLSALLAELASDLATPYHSSAAVERARQSALAAIRRSENQPGDQARWLLWSSLFPTGHPLSPPSADEAIADLSAITPGELALFQQRFYGPDDTGIVVVGDVDPGAIAAQLTASTASWPRVDDLDPARMQGWGIGPLQERAPVVDPLLTPSVVAIRLGEVVPLRRTDPGYYSADVMNAILGGASWPNRLERALGVALGQPTGASSSFEIGRLPGPWVLRATVRRSQVNPALASLRQAVQAYLADGPSSDEVTDARSFLIGRQALQLTSSSGMARCLARAMYYWDPAATDDPFDPRTYFSTFEADVAAVTRDRVVDAARRLLNPDAATVAIAGPYGGTGQP